MNYNYGFNPHGGFNHRGRRHRRHPGFGGIRPGFILPFPGVFPLVFVL